MPTRIPGKTWSHVISDVDQVAVVFTEYAPGIGGLPLLWLNAIDNFTVERGGNEPVDVPAVSRTGLVSLIVLTLLVGLAGLLRQRRIGWPAP